MLPSTSVFYHHDQVHVCRSHLDQHTHNTNTRNGAFKSTPQPSEQVHSIRYRPPFSKWWFRGGHDIVYRHKETLSYISIYRPCEELFPTAPPSLGLSEVAAGAMACGRGRAVNVNVDCHWLSTCLPTSLRAPSLSTLRLDPYDLPLWTASANGRRNCTNAMRN